MKTVQIETTPLQGLLLIRPATFTDERGYFYESWTQAIFDSLDIDVQFLQDNCSLSKRNILRGLHIQKGQAKLLWVTYGHVFQVSVDVRLNSPTYGQYFAIELKHDNPVQVFLPPGFANGFCVLSDIACMNYKCSELYSPSTEGGILWRDMTIGIDWPVKDPIVSSRDQQLPTFENFDSSSV